MTLQIGLYAPTWPGADRATPRWPAIRALARDAEALGVDTFWVADEPGFWECWTILTALAEATATIGIGPLIACTRYRSPALFATMVRALDEVSGGRVTLGLGSGSGPSDRRWTAFGFDATAHVSRFAEAVEIVARLVRDGPTTFDGRFYTIADPGIGPAGPTAGGPPIWVAGGKPRTMEVAARWGDAINDHDALPNVTAVAAFRERAEVACASTGRDPASVALTGWARVAPSPDGRLDADREDTIAGTPAAIAERLAAIHEAGIAHLTVFIGDEEDGHQYPALTPRALERFASVLEALRAAGSAAPGG
jgi:alkanesulfonate monooxygenase SsuD/methylene tetrahydromethanopterin reductase-like flavin-dependent oxidoreductase (luciferase family)